jgi:hypothetical protein
MYRVRRHDGSILEGHVPRDAAVPAWWTSVKSPNSGKSLDIVYGWIRAENLKAGDSKTLVAMPDNKVVLVNNLRVREKLAGHESNT